MGQGFWVQKNTLGLGFFLEKSTPDLKEICFSTKMLHGYQYCRNIYHSTPTYNKKLNTRAIWSHKMVKS
jgi:hypothetical protein